ncbi:Y-family DNA polymerase [Sulfurospirillum sp. 1307]
MYFHLDLDAFFVSAERSINPKLLNKPVAIGGRSDPYIFSKKRLNRDVIFQNSGAFVSAVFIDKNRKNLPDYFCENGRIRGIVTTSSYEARAFGIKTGMSIAEAKSRCPHLIVIKPNYSLYHRLSKDLRHYMQEKVPIIEQFSIDEFFGDLHGWIEDKNIYDFLKNLQNEIFLNFKLPCSIGIAKSKWIAKLATQYAKPFGIKLVSNIDEFIKDIPIEDFPFIGKSMQKTLYKYKKYTLGDIKNSKTLLYSLSNQSKIIYDRVCGLDNEIVKEKEKRKSVGISRTFDEIADREEIKRRLYILCRHLSYMVTKLDLVPTTIYLSIRYKYTKKRKQATFNRLFNEKFLTEIVINIFIELDGNSLSPIIRLSISLSNFINKKNFVPSILDIDEDLKQYNLTKESYKLKSKYGIDIIRSAKELI